MGKEKKAKIKKVKRRNSIITIIIVVLFIAIAALATDYYLKHRDDGEDEGKKYITHVDEEDMMIDEYGKINNELHGIYAFAIVDNNLAAIKNRGSVVNIIQIDPQKAYDYLYNNTNLYLLEKDSGIVSVVPLKTKGGYQVTNTINLNCKVESFEVYKDDIFYISDSKLYKYNNGTPEEWNSDISGKNLVIKKDEIYVVKQGNLIKQDMNKVETQLAQSVNDISYYNYYERNRMIFDVQYDDENVFKSIYNFYTSEISNSVKNNTYFVPYGASEYVYTTNDKMDIMKITKSGSSKYIYNSENEIKDMVFLKEGYLLLKTDTRNLLIKLQTGKEEINDNIIDFHNIKYLK